MGADAAFAHPHPDSPHPPTPTTAAGEIKGELLIVFGRQDPHIDRPGRDKIHKTLDDAGVNFQMLEVNGAHAFLRDENSGGRYDPELALLCYGMAIGVLNRTLKSVGDAPAVSSSVDTNATH